MASHLKFENWRVSFKSMGSNVSLHLRGIYMEILCCIVHNVLFWQLIAFVYWWFPTFIYIPNLVTFKCTMFINILHRIEMFHGVSLSVLIQSSNLHNHFCVMGPQNYSASTKPGSCLEEFILPCWWSHCVENGRIC